MTKQPRLQPLSRLLPLLLLLLGGAALAREQTIDLARCGVTLTCTGTVTATPVATPPPPPPPGTIVLLPSGSVTATANGQVIQNLRITGNLIINGRSDVVVRNVEVLHASGHGVSLTNAPRTVLENVSIRRINPPASGVLPSEQNNVLVQFSPNSTFTAIRTWSGSSGFWILESPTVRLSRIECHDARGPFPRGQCVQLDKSPNAVLEDFSYEHVAGVSWEEDNISAFNSSNVIVRRGLIDGNNANSGVGVMIEQLDQSTGGLVEDVDALRMGNGAFSGYPARNVIFRRTRARQNICVSQDGRGAPLSNALVWAGRPGSSGLRIEQGKYFALCNPGNLVWDQGMFTLRDVASLDFTPRAPQRLTMPWE